MANVIGGKLAAVGNVQINSTAASSYSRPASNTMLAHRARQLLNKIDRSLAGYLGSLAEARVRAPLDKGMR